MELVSSSQKWRHLYFRKINCSRSHFRFVTKNIISLTRSVFFHGGHCYFNIDRWNIKPLLKIWLYDLSYFHKNDSVPLMLLQCFASIVEISSLLHYDFFKLFALFLTNLQKHYRSPFSHLLNLLSSISFRKSRAI